MIKQKLVRAIRGRHRFRATSPPHPKLQIANSIRYVLVIDVFVELLLEELVLVELEVVLLFPPLSSLLVLDPLVVVGADVVVAVVAGVALDVTGAAEEDEELVETAEPELDEVFVDVISVVGPVVCAFQ